MLVRGERGPVEDVEVLACTEAWCLSTSSGSQGAFAFTTDPDVALAIKTEEEGEGLERFGAALAPCVVGDAAGVDIGTLYQPSLPADLPWGPVETEPQSFATAGGLTLTLVRADLSLAVFGVFDDVASAQIPEPYTASYPDLGEEALLAAYAVHPFGATSRSPVAVSLPTTLPAGSTANIRSVNYLDGRLSPPAIAVSDGETLSTLPGQGLDQLTYVVVSLP